MFENKIWSGIQNAINELNSKIGLKIGMNWKYSGTIIPVDQINEWSREYVANVDLDLTGDTNDHVIIGDRASSLLVFIDDDEELELLDFIVFPSTGSKNVIVQMKDENTTLERYLIAGQTTVVQMYSSCFSDIRLRSGDSFIVTGTNNAGDGARVS